MGAGGSHALTQMESALYGAFQASYKAAGASDELVDTFLQLMQLYAALAGEWQGEERVRRGTVATVFDSSFGRTALAFHGTMLFGRAPLSSVGHHSLWHGIVPLSLAFQSLAAFSCCPLAEYQSSTVALQSPSA